MLKPSDLHVFAARSNPLHWKAPHQNWERFAKHMLDSGVTLTVIECAYAKKTMFARSTVCATFPSARKPACGTKKTC